MRPDQYAAAPRLARGPSLLLRWRVRPPTPSSRGFRCVKRGPDEAATSPRWRGVRRRKLLLHERALHEPRAPGQLRSRRTPRRSRARRRHVPKSRELNKPCPVRENNCMRSGFSSEFLHSNLEMPLNGPFRYAKNPPNFFRAVARSCPL